MIRLTIIFLLLPFFLFSQKGNSPFSNIGLGDLNGEEYINNSAMGGVGVGIPTPFHINVNPAFLPHNSLTAFEIGLSGESNQIKTGTDKKNVGTGNLRYLAFAFPVAKKYSISLGLKPLTTVNYNFTQVNSVVNDTSSITYSYKGEGGINSVFISQGLQLTKYLSVGLRAAYNFGAIKKSFSSFSPELSGIFEIENLQETNYRGLSLAPSVGMRLKLNKNWYLNAGAVYEIEGNWSYSRSDYFRRINTLTAGVDDSRPIDYIEGKVKYPSAINGGVSIEKLYKWALGVDVKAQNWNAFESVDGSDKVTDILRIGLGGQIIPDANAVKGYFNRVIYRAGIHYSQSSFEEGGKGLTDYGANLGASFPVGRLSFINLALSYGVRGNVRDNSVQENYFRVHLGVTLNDRWFVRSKFD